MRLRSKDLFINGKEPFSTINEIQNVLLSQSIPESVTVYRVSQQKPRAGLEREYSKIINLNVGEIVNDPAFQSSFLEYKENDTIKEYTDKLSEKFPCCLFLINVPKGFPALYIGHSTAIVLPEQKDEDELLLPYNTSLQLVKKYIHPKLKRMVYEMNAIPPDPKLMMSWLMVEKLAILDKFQREHILTLNPDDDGKFLHGFEREFTLSWHGRISLQRYVWQSVIQNPTELVNLSKVAKGYLLRAWTSTRLSYLITATPNWQSVPPTETIIEGEDRYNIDSMGRLKVSADPPNYVKERLIDAALTLTKHPLFVEGNNDNFAHTSGLYTFVEELQQIVNEAQLAQYTAGVAGASTEASAMAKQSIGVLCIYNEFNSRYGVHTIDLGIMSHALDARHLIAVMWYRLCDFESLSVSDRQTKRVAAAKSALDELLTSDNMYIRTMMNVRYLACLDLLKQKHEPPSETGLVPKSLAHSEFLKLL